LKIATVAMTLKAVATGKASISFGVLGTAICGTLAPPLPFITAIAADAAVIYVLTSRQREDNYYL